MIYRIATLSLSIALFTGIAFTAAISLAQEKFDLDRLLESRLEPEALDQGWIRLFDGQTMMGWEDAGKANWHVEENGLVADKGENGLLVTTVSFQDYELSVEFWAEENTNSGVFLRTPPSPKDPGTDCLELNIAPRSNPFPTGSLVYREKVNEQTAAPKAGEWHRFDVKLVGDQCEVKLDGVECLRYNDTSKLRSGRVGLQFREGKIAFREIKIKPTGKTLIPGDKNEFRDGVQVKTAWDKDGALTIEGGRGHVESKETFANGFVRFAASTLTENVNSGIFIRCIPGEDMNGYECQLHHGFKTSRLEPVDSGTGAIFRRQAARAVLSDEGKKAHVTIVADGPRIATWVEGVQVVDWTDTRKADANPRRGLRLEAGTLMLQGHDPASRVRFDSLQIGNAAD